MTTTSATSARSPTRPERTARPKPSSASSNANGHTDWSTPPAATAPKPSQAGCAGTTTTDHTAASTATHPSAASHTLRGPTSSIVRGRYRCGMPGHRYASRRAGVLFVVLALGLLGIAVAAASAREWAVAVAAAVLGAWMADLALRDLGVRGRAVRTRVARTEEAAAPGDRVLLHAMQTTPPALRAPLDAYMAWLQGRGASPATMRAYAADLRQLDRWLAAAGTRPEDADDLAMRRFAAHLGTLRYAPATSARKLSAARSAYAFMLDRGLVARNPAAARPRPAAASGSFRRRSPSPRSSRLLDRPPAPEPRRLRDRAMIELLYGCGLRASEACGLRDRRRGCR